MEIYLFIRTKNEMKIEMRMEMRFKFIYVHAIKYGN